VLFVLALCYNAAMINERDLWAAVLGLAFEDLRDTKTGYRTRLWFASDTYEPGSFLWICDHLEIDATSIRREALGRGEAPRRPGAALPEQMADLG
jgi:hypothetical protein